MNSLTIKLITFFVSVFIILTVISQIYFSLNNKQRSEQAIFYTAVDSLSFEGIFVRNENVIDFDGIGVLNYIYPDGSKIAKDSVVAEIYSDEKQIETIAEIEQLELELSYLERVINPGTVSIAQPEFISEKINQK